MADRERRDSGLRTVREPARSRDTRVIPNWQLSPPADAPISLNDAEDLAESAVLSGSSGTSALPSENQIDTMLNEYSSTLYQTGLATSWYT